MVKLLPVFQVMAGCDTLSSQRHCSPLSKCYSQLVLIFENFFKYRALSFSLIFHNLSRSHHSMAPLIQWPRMCWSLGSHVFLYLPFSIAKAVATEPDGICLCFVSLTVSDVTVVVRPHRNGTLPVLVTANANKHTCFCTHTYTQTNTQLIAQTSTKLEPFI